MQEWTPFVGAKLECQREETNEQDPHVVVMRKRTAGCRTKVVGHVPRRISAACTLFLQRSGNVNCTIANWSKMLFFRFTTGWTGGALYTAAGGKTFHLPRVTT